MLIIGHRGLKGPSIENTLESLRAADSLGVDAVEFDVRTTKDNKLVVCHNKNLQSIYGINKDIGDLTYSQVMRITSESGRPIPTFKDVLQQGLKTPLAIDLKDIGQAKLISHEIKKLDFKNIFSINSLYFGELEQLKKINPDLELSLQEYKHPFKAIKRAKKIRITSVTLVLYLLNPITYIVAKRAGIKIVTYQNYFAFLLNSAIFVKLLGILYPNLTVITNRPDKIVPAIKRK